MAVREITAPPLKSHPRTRAYLPVATSILTAVVWGSVAMVGVITCLYVCIRESTSYTCTHVVAPHSVSHYFLDSWQREVVKSEGIGFCHC